VEKKADIWNVGEKKCRFLECWKKNVDFWNVGRKKMQICTKTGFGKKNVNLQFNRYGVYKTTFKQSISTPLVQ